jgi:peptidoglycan/LPS O-acetylase OafA/YrhL
VAVIERILPSDIHRTALGFGLAAAVYAATLIGAAACFRVVEMPAVAVGARIARRVRARAARASGEQCI